MNIKIERVQLPFAYETNKALESMAKIVQQLEFTKIKTEKQKRFRLLITRLKQQQITRIRHVERSKPEHNNERVEGQENVVSIPLADTKTILYMYIIYLYLKSVRYRNCAE